MTVVAALVICMLGVLTWIVTTLPPQKAAALLMRSGPVALIGFGALLIIIGRGVIGLPLVLIGINWLRRLRSVRPIASAGGQKSTVRTNHLEMELDHDTGEMDGTILTGRHQGSRLSSLSEEEIIGLCREFRVDEDTFTLLESYLDRNHPGWRDDAGSESYDHGSGRTSTGSMSKKEAREILGVSNDASRDEILAAWRRLIKKVHPDSGGSAFLTEKINTAKDVLLQ